MQSIDHLPRHLISLGKTSFRCMGATPETRCIEVEGIQFNSIQRLIKTFPELMHHPAALAKCVNFLYLGDNFKVITDPLLFKRNYFSNSSNEIETSLGKVDFGKMHSPRFSANTFVYFAWNEANDLPYKVTCAYPFDETHADVRYELM